MGVYENETPGFVSSVAFIWHLHFSRGFFAHALSPV